MAAYTARSKGVQGLLKIKMSLPVSHTSHIPPLFFFVETFVSAAELLMSVMHASSFINVSSLSHYHFRFLL